MHLVSNLHPTGGFMGLGTSPERIILVFLARGSGIGIEEIRAFVYG